jgi:hypothetical protein
MTDEKHYVLCFWEDYYEVHGPYDSADPLNAYGNWCEEKNSKDENWSTWFGMKANDPQPLAVYAPDLGGSTLKKSQGGLGDYIVVWEWTHGLGYELFGPCDDAGAFGEEWQAYHGDCPCWQPVTLQDPFAAPRVVSPSAEDQAWAERQCGQNWSTSSNDPGASSSGSLA